MIDPDRPYPLSDYANAVGKSLSRIRRLANAGLLPGVAFRPYANAQWMVLGAAILAIPGQDAAKRKPPSQVRREARKGIADDQKRVRANV